MPSASLLSGIAAAVSRFCCGGEQPCRDAGKLRSQSSWCKSGDVAAVASSFDDASAKPLPYAVMSVLTQADTECIEQRHFFRKPASESARLLGRQTVGGGRRCRHGWPQAIMYDPLYKETPEKRYRLGDLTRLTCPMLVTAIDKFEKEGAMERYNERLSQDWEGDLGKINEAHRVLRLNLIGDRKQELEDVRITLGENAFGIAMRSGLASLRPEARPDVKCLHAQVADELVRDGGNRIAQQTLKDLEDMGVQIHGSEECCDNCNVQMPLELARWRLHKCKNNVGKRLSRTRKHAAGSRAGSSVAGDTCFGDDDLDDDLQVPATVDEAF